MLNVGSNTPFIFRATAGADNPAQTVYKKPGVEISLILEGVLDFVEDGKHKEVIAPCISLQAYKRELFVSRPPAIDTKSQWCYFSSSSLTDDDWGRLERSPRVLPMSATLLSLFSCALAIDEEEGELSRDIRNSIGRTVFLEYLRCATTGQQHGVLPRSVRTVKKMIDRDPGKRWTLSELAGGAGTTSGHLIYLFKEHLGYTPFEYLWDQRHERAVIMLKTSILPVEQIAYRTGFQSSAHFSRSVKKRTGHSPSALRNLSN